MSHQFENGTDFYVVGGTLKADAPSYIERKADRELYEHILKGDFCCVLTPRQMGKSSLMIRTARRLKKQGHRTAVIDLTRIGTGKEKTSADQWYYGIAYRILRELGMDTKLSEWWQEREKLPALQRLTEFFEDVLLPGTHEPVVIFVDEIDTTIALPFTDDFFAAVRACYNARAANPAYQRLNFVLLGVASPSDLIKDAQRTPFNIGHGIRLTDFTPAEAKPLSLGLCADPAQGEKMLARILYWTGGHPYLTQKLCRIAAEEKLAAHSDEVIDNLVEKNFLAPGAGRQEPNLKFVSDRLLQDRKNSRQRLKLYRQVYNEKPVLDDPLSPTHTSLKLSGLVVLRTRQRLSIRNRIYERVFTGEWIKEVIPIDWNRNISVGSLFLLLLGFVIWYLFFLPQQYIEIILKAQDDVPINAYDKLKRILFQRKTADYLFADYWDRRALLSDREENRDESLIYHLKALTIKESAARRSEASKVIGDDYKNLMITYRHNRAVTSVAFSPDGKTVLTGSSDGTARLWQAATGKPLSLPMKHGTSVSSVAFSKDGTRVLTVSYDGTARLWDVATEKQVSTFIKHIKRGSSVVFSPDGKNVLTENMDGTARLWRADAKKTTTSTIDHGDLITSVAISPDGRTVITGGFHGTAQLWEVTSGKSLALHMKHGAQIHSIVFGMDGKTVFTGSYDGTARLWNVATGKPITPPMKHGYRVYTGAISPNGKRLLTGSSDGTAQLWDADTGKPVFSTMKHGEQVISVAFSPDGKTLITGGYDGTAHLWQAATGKPVSSPMKHELTITSVAISPDGKTVLTGSADGTALLWEAASGNHVSSPIKHGDWVNSVAFSPDGKTIMAASAWWIHQSIVSGDTIKPKASRLLPGRWTGAYRFLDDQGDHMQVAVLVTGDSIKIIDLHFDKPDAPPLQGDPDKLLKEWQKKLALKLNEETGKIEPMYPLEKPVPPNSEIIVPPSVGGARPAESKISGKKIKNQDGD